MFDNYIEAVDKRAFIQDKSISEKIDIYRSLTQDYDLCYEFVNMLSSEDVQKMFQSFDNVSRVQFIKFLPQEKMRQVYDNASLEDRRSLLNNYEMAQALSLHKLNDYSDTIVRFSDNIVRSNDVIQDSEQKIFDARISIDDAKTQIKVNNISLKRMEKIRRKLERKTGRLGKRACVGLFKKKKLEKLRELNQELNQVKSDLNQLYRDNSEHLLNIENMREQIRQSEEDIQNAKDTIQESKENMKKASKEAKETRKAIARLNRQQKKIFGRRLFKKNIHMRGHFLTTMKKEDLMKFHQATENEAIVNQDKSSDYDRVSVDVRDVPISTVVEEQTQEKDQSQEVVEPVQKAGDSKKDIEDKSQRVDDVIQRMVDNSANLLPMAPVNASPNLGTNNQVVVTISKKQLAELAAMISFNLEKRQQMQMAEKMEQARQEGRVDESGKIIDFEQGRQRVRSRSGNAAFVSVSILVMVISTLITFVGLMLLLYK